MLLIIGLAAQAPIRSGRLGSNVRPMSRISASLLGALRSSLVHALRAARSNFEGIPLSPRGFRPVTAISLDLHLQQGYVEVSLRTMGEGRSLSIGDWSLAGFLSSLSGPRDEELSALASVALSFYHQIADSDYSSRADRAHLLYLLSAEVLLDRQVAEILNDYKINAPFFGSALGGHPFTYVVLDPEEMIRGNYCEIVRANQVTSRVLHGLA